MAVGGHRDVHISAGASAPVHLLGCDWHVREMGDLRHEGCAKAFASSTPNPTPTAHTLRAARVWLCNAERPRRARGSQPAGERARNSSGMREVRGENLGQRITSQTQLPLLATFRNVPCRRGETWICGDNSQLPAAPLGPPITFELRTAAAVDGVANSSWSRVSACSAP